MQNAAPWWGRISLLWLMVAPLCVVLYTLCLPIAPNDFWYHARAGGLTATTGHIPTTNTYSAGLPADEPYFYQSWLAELTFYKVLQHGGLAWIVILRSVCMGLAYVLAILAIARRCRRVAVSQAQLAQQLPTGTDPTAKDSTALPQHIESPIARCTAFGALMTLAMSANNMDVRPQTFSFPLFALFMAALFEWPYATAKTRAAIMVVLPITMMLWANLHGAFFTGIIAVTAVFVGEALYSWWHKRSRRRLLYFGAPLSADALRKLGLLVLLCVAAAMVNPRGVQIYPYVVKLSTEETGQKYIMEWQHPTFKESGSVAFFCSFLILAVLIVAIVRRRPTTREIAATTSPNSIFGFRFAELLLLAALAVMGWRNARSIVWYALFSGPILGALGIILMAKLRRHSTSGTDNTAPIAPGVYFLNAAMALLLLALIVPVLPWRKPALAWPVAYRQHFAPTPPGEFPNGFSGDPPLLLDRHTPVEAGAFLQLHPPRGRLFNEMVFGSYLTWVLQPHRVSYADPRVELYPTYFWDEYRRLCSGPPDAAAFLEQHGFTDALLDIELQRPLVQRLRSAPGWHVVLHRRNAVLFRFFPLASPPRPKHINDSL